MGWRFLFRSTSNNKTLEQNNETTSPKSHGSKNLLFNQISIVYSNISHVDGRHCQVAWSHATLSMLFSFCSVSVPIPLCCHLLSLGPCGGLLARFCGVQSGCRGPVEVGGGWVDYGQHAHQAHIQPSSSRHVGFLYVTALHAAHSLPPSPLLPVAPRNPSFPQCLRLT